jgi:hypothetical protein
MTAATSWWVCSIVTLKIPVLTAATPMFSPNGLGLALPTQTATITSGTSGASICYTADGSTPTASTPGTCSHGTTLANGGSVSISTVETIQAIATKSAYANSATASAVFNVAPDQTGSYSFSDNFSSYYNASEQDNLEPILNTWNTVGKWTPNGTPLAVTVQPTVHLDTIRGGSNYMIEGNAEYWVTSTGYTGWNSAGNGQYASASLHYLSLTQCVLTHSSTTGALNGYQLCITPSAGSAYFATWIAGTPSYPCNVSGLTVTDGESIELRSLNGYHQPLLGGAQIPGCASSYADATYTTGSPAIGGGGLYNFVAGLIDASTPLSAASYAGPIYATYGPFPGTTSGDTSFNSWPWEGFGSSGGQFQEVQVGTSGVYALGETSNGIAREQYVAPFRNAQYIIGTIATDTNSTAAPVQNWFFMLQSHSVILGASSGTGCYDTQAYYIGAEPCNQASCTGTSEYAATNYLHITKDTPATNTPIGSVNCSVNSNVVTVSGSSWAGHAGYIPMAADQILVIYDSAGYLSAYCKGTAHSATAPGGNGCPSTTNFFQVIHVQDNDLLSGNGYPGLWSGNHTPNNTPIFQNVTIGSMNSGVTCASITGAACIAPVTYVPMSFIP